MVAARASESGKPADVLVQDDSDARIGFGRIRGRLRFRVRFLGDEVVGICHVPSSVSRTRSHRLRILVLLGNKSSVFHLSSKDLANLYIRSRCSHQSD